MLPPSSNYVCGVPGPHSRLRVEFPGGCLYWAFLSLLGHPARAGSKRMKLTPDKPDSQPEGWLLPYVEGSVPCVLCAVLLNDQHPPVLPAPPNYHWVVKLSLPPTSVVLVNGPSAQEVNAGL